MKTYKQRLNYEKLELISSQELKPQTNDFNLLSVLKKIGNYLLTALTEEPNLHIRQQEHRLGNTSWTVYDPQTGQSTQCSSEEDVRIWIDERYYQKQKHTTQNRIYFGSLYPLNPF
jgi:hypothetical protein